MICPYRNGKFTEKQLVKRGYNGDAQEVNTIVITTQEFKIQECLKEECAVWHNEKCEYKG